MGDPGLGADELTDGLQRTITAPPPGNQKGREQQCRPPQRPDRQIASVIRGWPQQRIEHDQQKQRYGTPAQYAGKIGAPGNLFDKWNRQQIETSVTKGLPLKVNVFGKDLFIVADHNGTADHLVQFAAVQRPIMVNQKIEGIL